jgi:hypothetical protein
MDDLSRFLCRDGKVSRPHHCGPRSSCGQFAEISTREIMVHLLLRFLQSVCNGPSIARFQTFGVRVQELSFEYDGRIIIIRALRSTGAIHWDSNLPRDELESQAGG